MKKLVLESLLLIGVASQATGCIMSDEEDAVITAEWSFRELATNSNLSCPEGFNTVALYNQPVDLDNRPVGQPIIDLFDCSDFRHDSAPLPADVYRTWISVTSGSGGSVYADSLSAYVDVVDSDKTFKAMIADDGGYFAFDWDLRDSTTNQPLTCGADPDLDGIEIISTLSGETSFKVDKFNCDDGYGVTDALIEGTYQLSIDAFTDAGAGGRIGPSTNISNQVIRAPNKVTDLGTVIVELD
ncbi:MAG: hypothetical protein ACTHU0_29765 [Kofleriaceae bacterium]